jgi:hypothetical protein
MTGPEDISKYAMYFIGFCILLVVGVVVVSSIAGPSVSTNNSTTLVSTTNEQITQGFNLLSIGAVILAAVILLKVLNLF